jgi:hypothetical protein
MFYLYINSNVPEINIIKDSLNTNISIIKSFSDIDFSKPIDRIGLMFKKNGKSYIPFPLKNTLNLTDNLNIIKNIPLNNYCSNGFIQLLEELLLNNIMTTIDLITCDLNDILIIEKINKLEKKYNVIINYSIDKTGNYNMEGDWILESSNENIKDIYFTNKINNWHQVLDNVIITEDNKYMFFYPSDNLNFNTLNNIITLSGDISFYNTPELACFDMSENWTFDGNNYTIEIMNIDQPIYYGLFDIDNSSTIQKVNILLGEQVYLSDEAVDSLSSGGIVKENNNNFTVSGCILIGDISGDKNGGICGQNCGVSSDELVNINIINCTISGSIINYGSAFIGGICNVGNSIVNIEKCNLFGDIINGFIIGPNCNIGGRTNTTVGEATMNIIGCNIYGNIENNGILGNEGMFSGLIYSSNIGIYTHFLQDYSMSTGISNMNIINCTISGDIINSSFIGSMNNLACVNTGQLSLMDKNAYANMYISNCNINGNIIEQSFINSFNNIANIGCVSGNIYKATMYINNCTMSGDISGSALCKDYVNIGYVYSEGDPTTFATNISNLYINNCLIRTYGDDVSGGNIMSNLCNKYCAINTVSGLVFDEIPEISDDGGNSNMYITNTFTIKSNIPIYNNDCSYIYYNAELITELNNNLIQLSDDVVSTNYNFYKDIYNVYQLNNYIENVGNISTIPLNRIIYPQTILSNIYDGSGVNLIIDTNNENFNPQIENYVVLHLTPSNTLFSTHIGFELTLPIQGSNDVQVYYYNGSTTIIIEPTNTHLNNQYYTITDDKIIIYTNHFSDFFINYQYVPCVGQDTLILMANGIYKKIIDIKRGDYIQCMNEKLPVSRIKYIKFNIDMKCNYCIIPKNTQINNTILFESLLITGYHPILINQMRIPVEHIKFNLRNGIYNIYLNCKSQTISQNIILCDLQFDKPTYYNANGIWIQSSSPYTKNDPLPYDLYWDKSYYSDKLTTNDPEFYKEELITYPIYNQKIKNIFKLYKNYNNK